jgi:asparagine synthase (glutamine-hydrolysing)
MAHSLEARSPLLDPAMMELAAALPIGMKIEPGTTKRIFKRAMREWLPPQIVDRSKMGFKIPVAPGFGGACATCPATSSCPRTLERGLFREQRLREIVDEHLDGSRDHGDRIWTLLQLDLWLRTYVGAPLDGPLDLAIAATDSSRSA